MSSILTNNGAMVALQTLQTVNRNLTETQNAISTGKKIETAKDNAAVWAISKTMESDIAGFEAIEEGLSMGDATVAVASAGAEQIVEKLVEIKELVVSAQAENVSHSKIQTDIDSKVAQIESIISAAQFNGANLLKDTIDGTATEMGVLASLDRVGAGGTVSGVDITIAAQAFESNLNLGTSLTTITDTTTAESALAEIESFLQIAISGAAELGAASARIEDQSMFVADLVDSMTLGVSAMTDTNMEEASARLSALQTQQDLAVQSLGIANEAPQALLQLFQ
ncbi:flagellin [Phaeobacter sp. HF9A]|uniref:flagellin N-terminal helical domain-containing protein n=1 Tax=Phaeobacter sp. HF9A TaxID=2721561 RepID=UPI0014321C4D|nr:flagellin [Phaeobacter sp. HF9A]NIZ13521.1 flagellin [Phaeobacter sp. HF9A]